ncbi:Hypothetical predicted protein [Pelobates cultripes]|uniref:Uncharacterized protein n=1 Tax=Pelobates cultripes TaxID=61616 RepID=A0AAD1SKF5_PELCU|nr:Hypothetical predicted protein [Pelobates cultripes]
MILKKFFLKDEKQSEISSSNVNIEEKEGKKNNFVNPSHFYPVGHNGHHRETFNNMVMQDLEQLSMKQTKNKFNLSKQEAASIQKLQKMDNIVIKEADKGGLSVYLSALLPHQFAVLKLPQNKKPSASCKCLFKGTVIKNSRKGCQGQLSIDLPADVAGLLCIPSLALIRQMVKRKVSKEAARQHEPDQLPYEEELLQFLRRDNLLGIEGTTGTETSEGCDGALPLQEEGTITLTAVDPDSVTSVAEEMPLPQLPPQLAALYATRRMHSDVYFSLSSTM